MTSTDVAVTDNYPVGTVAAERVRLAEQVRVAVLLKAASTISRCLQARQWPLSLIRWCASY